MNTLILLLICANLVSGLITRDVCAPYLLYISFLSTSYNVLGLLSLVIDIEFIGDDYFVSLMNEGVN